MPKRVLIIKLGYCETLVNEQGFVPSLGDVFRHTVLLHRYAHDKVTWLTSDSAVPLLRDNVFISELITYDENTTDQLKGREFDEVVCIEKSPTICKLAARVKAGVRYGFDWKDRIIEAHPLAQSTLDIANGKDHFLPIQALLYQMVGDYWRGEDYVLGYRPRPMPAYDVGLNHLVGSKWPTKAWPTEYWKKVEKLLQEAGLIVSWQQGEKDIERYMDWINGGRLILTCDSLGMHLGLAMRKKVVAMFGPSPTEGIYMYGRGEIIRATGSCGEAPCMKSACEKGCLCMREIEPATIVRVIINLLNRPATPTVLKTAARPLRRKPRPVLVPA